MNFSFTRKLLLDIRHVPGSNLATVNESNEVSGLGDLTF